MALPVCAGATLQCSFGLAPSTLVVVPAGPPAVMTRACSKPPCRPPMIEIMTMKNVVGARWGQVTCRNVAQRPAPSISAAS